MSDPYVHGPETIEVERGPRPPVRGSKSSVIGLVGTAPTGAVNQPIQCLPEKDAAQFGPEINGFTIPQALRAIYDHGAGTVVVINVLDPKRHTRHVDESALKFDAQHQRVWLRLWVREQPSINKVLIAKPRIGERRIIGLSR